MAFPWQVVCCNWDQWTDAGLVHLTGLNHLVVLNLEETQVTDAGVAQLEKALPTYDIIH